MNFLMMLLALVAMVLMAAAAPINDSAIHWTPINETAIQWTTLPDGTFPLTLTIASTMSGTWALTSPFPTGLTYSASAVLTLFATLASPFPSATSTGLPTIDTAASPSVFPTAGPQNVARPPFPIERRANDAIFPSISLVAIPFPSPADTPIGSQQHAESRDADDDNSPFPTPSPIVHNDIWPALKDDTPLGFPLPAAAAAVFPEPSHNEKRHSHPPVIVDLNDIENDEAAVLLPRGRLAADDPRIGSIGYKHYLLSLKAASKERRALEEEEGKPSGVSAENACVGGVGPDCATVASVSRRPHRSGPDAGDRR
ncbi:MAG: hypothetical protein Q9178_003838 [Gyalolechia marmorata]